MAKSEVQRAKGGPDSYRERNACGSMADGEELGHTISDFRFRIASLRGPQC